ncbi:hypothetical protein ACOIV3_002068, partial [Vibrio vulnificus]
PCLLIELSNKAHQSRYIYDSLSSLFEQIWEHFTVLTFAAMISDLPHFLLESSPLLRMGCCKY